MAQEIPTGFQVIGWDGVGYHPCVSFGGWLVALMNWEFRFDPAGIGPIERHNVTDEVFVLVGGRSILFVHTEQGFKVQDMQPGVVYNVVQGTWHSVIGSRDARWLIVESSDTSQENSEYRQLTPEEIKQIQAQYPDWLRRL